MRWNAPIARSATRCPEEDLHGYYDRLKTFRTRQDAIAHCQAILHREQLETEIEGEDTDFVRAVLNLRKDKMQEIAPRTVVRFLRKMHRHNTPCFFAELSDGSFIDFSFMKAINTLPRAPVAGAL